MKTDLTTDPAGDSKLIFNNSIGDFLIIIQMTGIKKIMMKHFLSMLI